MQITFPFHRSYRDHLSCYCCNGRKLPRILPFIFKAHTSVKRKIIERQWLAVVEKRAGGLSICNYDHIDLIHCNHSATVEIHPVKIIGIQYQPGDHDPHSEHNWHHSSMRP